MKKTLLYLVLISITLMGIATAQNLIQGEAKGPDAPGALKVGSENQSGEVLGMLGVKGMELSGTDPSIFDQPFFAKDGWVTDGGSYGRTPTQMAFIQDKTGENLRWSPKQGDW